MDIRKLAYDIRKGDWRAYELFYRMEFNNLVHFIGSYTNDLAQAEDLAQETLSALYEKRETVDPEKNLRAFVYRIARNKTINALKEKRLFADSSRIKGITDEILAREDNSMEEMIESLELEKLIRNVYDSLPDSVRESFAMSRGEGMTNKEIAGKKGMSVKAVEYHITVSLRQFRKMLKDYFSL